MTGPTGNGRKVSALLRLAVCGVVCVLAAHLLLSSQTEVTPGGFVASQQMPSMQKIKSLRSHPYFSPSLQALRKSRTETPTWLGRDHTAEMYPHFNWAKGMRAVVPATRKLNDEPLMIAIAADTDIGTTEFVRRIRRVLDTSGQPSRSGADHTTVIRLDDYRIHNESSRISLGRTYMDPKEIDFDLLRTQIAALRAGHAIYKPDYNRVFGGKKHHPPELVNIGPDSHTTIDGWNEGHVHYRPNYERIFGEENYPPQLVEPDCVMIFQGLHPLVDEGVRRSFDLSIYLDAADNVKLALKAHCNPEDHGRSLDHLKSAIARNKPDFIAYVEPQKEHADIIIRIETADMNHAPTDSVGLPYLKVKMIQRKASGPTVQLTNRIELSGPVGGVIKSYDETWFGEPVTVIEMEGQFDDRAVEWQHQMEMVGKHLKGIKEHWPGEFADLMGKVRMQQLPGTLDGTGLFEGLIAMKARELYETRDHTHGGDILP
eukprot:TRINITY_DN112786_c0_g1_i1.p1 TRINITY_DN112786_c0_g1~~TRINITY_DN112786_c0_g1_i1.p1  ORF type:complete len:486 (+),score=68.07 TRINITY_DN112786_c0_g1_i1:55-1512(+)